MEAGAGPSNDEWFEEHIYELVQKYPNQWIAVSGGEVICASATRWGAKSGAKRATGGRNFSLYFIEPSLLQMGFARGSSPPSEGPR